MSIVPTQGVVMRGVESTEFQKILESPIPPHPLDEHLTPRRQQRFRQVLARRSTRIAVLVEECHDPHNATAVLRTCDALGLMRVHVVTKRNAFKVNYRVSQGSHLYLDLRVHPDAASAVAALHQDGYKVIATDLSSDAVQGPGNLSRRYPTERIAIAFGNEGHGITDELRALADGFLCLPMAGFTQSLNLSVTAAVILSRLREEALETDAPGDMDAATQTKWYDRWIRRARSLPPSQEEPQRDENATPGFDWQGKEVDTYRA